MHARKISAKKEKVTVSIDANLLRMVDVFVKQTKDANSRSSIFEQALHYWKQVMRDNFDTQYYMQNKDTLQADNESWKAISTEAAKYIWKK